MDSEPGPITYSPDRRTLTFTTDRNRFGDLGSDICGAPYFEVRIEGVRDNRGKVLDGDYDTVDGGRYVFRFLPPPC
jgi:hypothetical protein